MTDRTQLFLEVRMQLLCPELVPVVVCIEGELVVRQPHNLGHRYAGWRGYSGRIVALVGRHALKENQLIRAKQFAVDNDFFALLAIVANAFLPDAVFVAYSDHQHPNRIL